LDTELNLPFFNALSALFGKPSSAEYKEIKMHPEAFRIFLISTVRLFCAREKIWNENREMEVKNNLKESM
jgi:hypothetical protein